MSDETQSSETIEVFFSYDHEDEDLRDELEKHLSILERQGVITSWHDRKIGAGKEWEGEIDTHLNTARVILLLISPDFIDSDYCWDVEVKRAMERHETGEALVIPVILRAIGWRDAPFGKLNALPTDAKAVTSWENQDEAFEDIAHGIQIVISELKEGTLKSPDQEPVWDDSEIPKERTVLFRSPPIAKGFIGRKKELKYLLIAFGEPEVSVIHIGGASGIGKTYLAARLYEKVKEVYRPFWINCGAQDVTLETLLWELGTVVMNGDSFKSVVRDPTRTPEERIDALVRGLERGIYALWLDDYHKVKDSAGANLLVKKVAQSCRRTKFVLMAGRRPEVLNGLESPTGAYAEVVLIGLKPDKAREYLLKHGLPVNNAMASQIWEKAGKGNPRAMKIFAARTRKHSVQRLLEELPFYGDDERADQWFGSWLGDLSPEEQELTMSISIFRAPASREAMAYVWHKPDSNKLIDRLQDWYGILERHEEDTFLLCDLLRDYCYHKKLTKEDKGEYHGRAGEFYVNKALQAERAKMKELHKLEAHPHHLAEDEEIQDGRKAHFHYFAAQQFDKAAEILTEIKKAGLIDTGLLESMASGYLEDKLSRQNWMWICMIKGAVHGMRCEWGKAKLEYNKVLDVATEIHWLDAMGDAHLEVGWVHYFQGDLEGAMLHFEENRRIREQESGDRVELARSYDCLGYAYHLKDDWDTAEELHLKCKRILEEITVSSLQKLVVLSYCHNNLGLVSQARGKWGDAVRFYEQSIGYKEQSEEIVGQATVYDNLGNAYQAKHEWEKAIKCYEKSVNMREEIRSKVGINRVYTNLGSAYYLTGSKDKIFKRQVEDRLIQAETHRNLGECYQAIGDYIHAGQSYQTSLNIFSEADDGYGIAAVQVRMALLEKEEGDLGKALVLISQAEALFLQLGVSEAEGARQERERIRELLKSKPADTDTSGGQV